MKATGDSRLLQPSGERFRQDGAPSLPLSPSKGLRNALIIYEAIKSAPDKTLLRGDFDRLGKPWVYFPEREKKRIGQWSMSSATSLVKARNIDIDRQDMANFLSSIADAAIKMKAPDQSSLCAATVLNKIVKEVTVHRRDLRAGDIREPLRSLAFAYKRIQRQELIDAHQLRKQVSRLQVKRFAKFCTISGSAFSQLADALRPDKSKHYDVRPLLAVLATKQFLRAYQAKHADRGTSFGEYLDTTDIARDVAYFAKRWMAISEPVPTTKRMKYATESWSRELDRVCPAILKAYRRQMRDKPETGAPGGMPPRLLYLTSDPSTQSASPQMWNMPPLPSVPELPPLPPSPPATPEALLQPSSAIGGILMVVPGMAAMPKASEPDSVPVLTIEGDRSVLIDESFASVPGLPLPSDTDSSEVVSTPERFNMGAHSEADQSRSAIPNFGSDARLIADIQSLIQTPPGTKGPHSLSTPQQTSRSFSDVQQTEIVVEEDAVSDRHG